MVTIKRMLEPVTYAQEASTTTVTFLSPSLFCPSMVPLSAAPALTTTPEEDPATTSSKTEPGQTSAAGSPPSPHYHCNPIHPSCKPDQASSVGSWT